MWFLSAGECASVRVCCRFQVEEIEKAVNQLRWLGTTHVAQRQGQTNICRDGSPRQQRVALSHVADSAVDSLQRLSAEKNRAVCWREQAGDQVHRGGLAAPTWPQENQ